MMNKTTKLMTSLCTLDVIMSRFELRAGKLLISKSTL